MLNKPESDDEVFKVELGDAERKRKEAAKEALLSAPDLKRSWKKSAACRELTTCVSG